MKILKLSGRDISYIQNKSKRRSISAIVNNDGVIEVRTPHGVSDEFVREFLSSKAERILQMIDRHRQLSDYEEYLGDAGLSLLMEKAEAVIPGMVEYFSGIMGVKPARVRINSAKTRFGSCSGKGSLNFSCRVMAYSHKAVDYVVLHELAHLVHMNHSRDFWRLVEKYMPDYKDAKRELRELPKKRYR